MSVPKTTINSSARTVTFHLDQTEVKIPYTTFRQLMTNGGMWAAKALLNPNVRRFEPEDESIARIA